MAEENYQTPIEEKEKKEKTEGGEQQQATPSLENTGMYVFPSDGGYDPYRLEEPQADENGQPKERPDVWHGIEDEWKKYNEYYSKYGDPRNQPMYITPEDYENAKKEGYTKSWQEYVNEQMAYNDSQITPEAYERSVREDGYQGTYEDYQRDRKMPTVGEYMKKLSEDFVRDTNSADVVMNAVDKIWSNAKEMEKIVRQELKKSKGKGIDWRFMDALDPNHEFLPFEVYKSLDENMTWEMIEPYVYAPSVLLNNFRKYFGGLEQSEGFQKLMENISASGFNDSYKYRIMSEEVVKPIIEKAGTALENKLLQARIPKSTFEYIMKKAFLDSLWGAAKGAVERGIDYVATNAFDKQSMYSDEWREMQYLNQKVDALVASGESGLSDLGSVEVFGTKLTGRDAAILGASFMLDTPFFGALGKVSGAVISKITERQMANAIRTMGKEKAMQWMFQRATFSNLMEKGAWDAFKLGVERATYNSLAQTIVMGGYEGTKGFLNQLASGDEIDWGQAFEDYVVGGAKGFALGATGELTGKFAQAFNMGGRAEFFAKFNTEALTFGAMSYAEQMHQWEQEDHTGWTEEQIEASRPKLVSSITESYLTLPIIKMSSVEGFTHTWKSILSGRVNTPYAFSKDNIREANSSETVRNLVVSIDALSRTKAEGTELNEARQQVIDAYRAVMVDKEVSSEIKHKLAFTMAGQGAKLPRNIYGTATASYEVDGKTFVVTGRDKDGNKTFTKYLKSQKEAEEAVDDALTASMLTYGSVEDINLAITALAEQSQNGDSNLSSSSKEEISEAVNAYMHGKATKRQKEIAKIVASEVEKQSKYTVVNGEPYQMKEGAVVKFPQIQEGKNPVSADGLVRIDKVVEEQNFMNENGEMVHYPGTVTMSWLESTPDGVKRESVTISSQNYRRIYTMNQIKDEKSLDRAAVAAGNTDLFKTSMADFNQARAYLTSHGVADSQIFDEAVRIMHDDAETDTMKKMARLFLESYEVTEGYHDRVKNAGDAYETQRREELKGKTYTGKDGKEMYITARSPWGTDVVVIGGNLNGIVECLDVEYGTTRKAEYKSLRIKSNEAVDDLVKRERAYAEAVEKNKISAEMNADFVEGDVIFVDAEGNTGTIKRVDVDLRTGEKMVTYTDETGKEHKISMSNAKSLDSKVDFLLRKQAVESSENSKGKEPEEKAVEEEEKQKVAFTPEGNVDTTKTTVSDVWDYYENQRSGKAKQMADGKVAELEARIAELEQPLAKGTMTDAEYSAATDKAYDDAQTARKELDFWKEVQNERTRRGAQALIDEKQRNAEKVAKGEKGVVDNTSYDMMSVAPQLVAQADRLGKALGLTIEIQDADPENNGKNDGKGHVTIYLDANDIALYKKDVDENGNRIYHNATANQILTAVLGHEVDHSLFRIDPELARQFAQSVKESMGEERYQEIYDRKAKQYDDIIKGMTPEEKDAYITEEIASDYAGTLILDNDYLDSLLKKTFDSSKVTWNLKASKLEKVKGYFDGLLNKITGSPLDNVAENLPDVDEAKRQQIEEDIKTAEQQMAEGVSKARDIFAKMFENAKRIEEQKGITPADEKASQELEAMGAAVNRETGDAKMSLKAVLKGEEREKAIADLMKVTGRSRKTCEKYIKSEEALATAILDPNNRDILDLESDPDMDVIWNNSDYPQGTVEFSNICKKRLPLTNAYMRLQKEFPDLVFKANTLELMRQLFKDNGRLVSCGLCFVEDRRQLLGEIGRSFIESAKEGRPVAIGEDLSATSGDVDKANANQQKAIDLLKNGGTVTDKQGNVITLEPDDYEPNLFDLLTIEGFNQLKKHHRTVYEAFKQFNNARGMQAGRLFQAYSAYDSRDIMGFNKAKVKTINEAGGLRIFSFSDFEAHHLIDLVQILTDCSRKGIKIQGYTKQPEFAKAVKDTHMKVNRSLIPESTTGYEEVAEGTEGSFTVKLPKRDSNGNTIHNKNGKPEYETKTIRLVHDPVEGIDIHDPNFFDSTNNPDIGNILVGINDTHIRTAMLDPFVDYIIGFHSGLSQEIRNQKKIGHWTNYKLTQLDKKVNIKVDEETGGVTYTLTNASTHGVNIYTDILGGKYGEIKNKKDFVNAYLKEISERGWIPRFYQFLNTKSGRSAAFIKTRKSKGEDAGEVYVPNYEVLNDIMNGDDAFIYTEGYHKFLIDFKLFDKNGKIAPQREIVPKFDDEFNKQILEQYAEGVRSEVADDEMYDIIKNEFAKRGILDGEKYSKKLDDGSDLTAVDNADGTKDIEIKAPDGTRYSIKTWHGSAADFDHFDHKFFHTGEGSMYYGAGTYVSNVESTARMYAEIADSHHGYDEYVASYRGKDIWELVEDDIEKEPHYTKESTLRMLNQLGEDAETYGLDKLPRIYEERIAGYEADLEEEPEDINTSMMLDLVKRKYDYLKKGGIEVRHDKSLKHLYEVEIPDDNGRNYIDWNGFMRTDDMKVVSKALYERVLENDAENAYDSDVARQELQKEIDGVLGMRFLDGSNMYGTVQSYLNSDIEASRFLSELGYTGIKVPTGNLSGGDGRGMNYVIFNENDAQIVGHERFSKKIEHPVVYDKIVPKKDVVEFGDKYPSKRLANFVKGLPTKSFLRYTSLSIGEADVEKPEVYRVTNTLSYPDLITIQVPRGSFVESDGGYSLDMSNIMDTIKQGMRIAEGLYESGKLSYYKPNDGEYQFGNDKFSKKIEDADPFYSNAAKTVEGIKQEKATPEQWLAMITKNGGLKAGEDKWMGLSEWLKGQDKKTLTKQEVMDFIAQNAIKIEEVHYGEGDGTDEYYTGGFVVDTQVMHDQGFATLDFPLNVMEIVDEYNYNHAEKIKAQSQSELKDEDWERLEEWKYELEQNLPSYNAINETRLEYTTEGLDNKREIALTVPTIEPYNESDMVHFGDAGEGRAVAWIRFGDAETKEANPRVDELDAEIKRLQAEENPDYDYIAKLGVQKYAAEVNKPKGQKVLVIDEIQSKRHQDGRENGYARKITNPYVSEYKLDSAKGWSTADILNEDGTKIGTMFTEDGEYWAETGDAMTSTERTEEAVLRRLPNIKAFQGIPDAPFDKNWHELAMKRMLRYAAENGYDKVAWTTGTQQAERYGLGGVVDKITGSHDGENKYVDIYLKNGITTDFTVSPDGTIIDSEYKGQKVADVVGKDIAEKIMSLPKEEPWIELEGNNLQVGGEGMKGFYDKMLPNFMSKYGKKWGAKVGEVELDLPNEADRKMWSVDVTPEMKESVMQGQPMFSKKAKEFEDAIVLASKQDFGSAGTSINSSKLPSGFALVDKVGGFKEGTTNLDMGGGRFDNATEMLSGKGVTNMVFDPFNRDAEHNKKVAETAKNEGFDTVTCNNCLNVINAKGARSNVILQCAKALKEGGTAYFTVYEGNGSGEGKVTQNGESWQENRKTEDYLDEIREHFDDVTRKGKLIIAKNPKQTDELSYWAYNGFDETQGGTKFSKKANPLDILSYAKERIANSLSSDAKKRQEELKSRVEDVDLKKFEVNLRSLNDVAFDSEWTGKHIFGLDEYEKYLKLLQKTYTKEVEGSQYDSGSGRYVVEELQQKLDMISAERQRRAENLEKLAKEYNIDSDGSISLEDFSRLYYDLSGNKALSGLFDLTKGAIESFDIPITIKKIKPSARGIFQPEIFSYDGELKISNDMLARDGKGYMKGKTLLHEMIHAGTVKLLNDYEGGFDGLGDASELLKVAGIRRRMMDKDEKILASELFDIYDQLSQREGINKKGDKFYGLKNAKEMMAELANPEFRQWLSQQHLMGDKDVSALGRIKNWIKEWLLGYENTNVTGNALVELQSRLNTQLDRLYGEEKPVSVNDDPLQYAKDRIEARKADKEAQTTYSKKFWEGEPRRKRGESEESYQKRVDVWRRAFQRELEKEDEQNPMPVIDTENPFNASPEEYADITAKLQEIDKRKREAEGKQTQIAPQPETTPDDDDNLVTAMEMMKEKGVDLSDTGLRRHVHESILRRRSQIDLTNYDDNIVLKKIHDTLSKEEREEMIEILEGTFQGKPTQKQLEMAEVIRDWFDGVHENLKENGFFEPGREDAYLENYVTHIWDFANSDPDAARWYKETLRKNTPYVKHRVLDTYAQGIEMGLKPKYTDITDIMAQYGRYANEAIANRQFINTLEGISIDGKPVFIGRSEVDPDYVEMQNTAIADYKVLKEVVPLLNAVFGRKNFSPEESGLHAIGKGWDVLSGMRKKIALSLSGFHYVALTEGAISNIGVAKTAKVIVKNMLWDYTLMGMRGKGTKPVFQDPALTRDALMHGVKLGATDDYSKPAVDNFLDTIEKWTKEHDADFGTYSWVTRIVNKLSKGMDTALWDIAHDGYKLYAYKYMAKDLRKRCEKNGKTVEETERLLNALGQWINDSFGGQNWDNIGVSPLQMKAMRRALMSPDWTLSAMIRQPLSMIGVGNGYNAYKFRIPTNTKAWVEDWKWLKEAFGTPEGRQRIKYGYKFYISGLLQMGLAYMALNAYFRWKDKEEQDAIAEEKRKTDPDYKSPYELAYPNGMKWYDYTMIGNVVGNKTHLFTGRYSDGTERYTREGKQFREIPELIYGHDGFDFPGALINKMKGKLNPFIGDLFTLAGGAMDANFPNREMKDAEPGWDRTMAMASVALQMLYPYSMSGNTEFTPLDLFMPNSKGMRPYRARQLMVTAMEAKDANFMREVYQACVMNNLNVDDIFKAAQSEMKMKYKAHMMDGVEDLDDAIKQFNEEQNPDRKAKLKRFINEEMSYQYYHAPEMTEFQKKATDWMGDEDALSSEKDNTYLLNSTAEDVIQDEKVKVLRKKLQPVYDEYKENGSSTDSQFYKDHKLEIDMYVATQVYMNVTRPTKSALKKSVNQNEIDSLMSVIRDRRNEMFQKIDSLKTVE